MEKLTLPVTPSEVGSYTDFAGLARLKAEAQAGSPETLEKVARQFESLFLEMMLRSMREAKLGEGMFDSDAGEFYQSLFDKQIALDLAEGGGKGLGIAELLMRQLGARANPGTRTAPAGSGPGVPGAGTGLPVRGEERSPFPLKERIQGGAGVALPVGPARREAREPASPEEFVREVLPHARRTAATLGVHPLALVAQAAVETGWGRHVVPTGEGGSSFNFFGIKAGSEWAGAKVSTRTIEVERGLAVTRRASFRSYGSIAESFGDYARLLSGSPRYREVLERGATVEGFAEALGRSGYATDPEYAKKIKGIFNGTTLRKALEALKLPGLAPMT